MLSGLVLDALFPDACLSCLAQRDRSFRHEVVCEDCLRGVTLPDSFACHTCGTGTASVPPSCHEADAAQLILAASGSRVTGELASALLYEGIGRAAAPLGELLAAGAMHAVLPTRRTYLAPVPPLPAVLRERGYDADLAVAREAARILDLPLAPHLLTADKRGGAAAYGIGTPGDAASAHLIAFVSVTELGHGAAVHCANLAQAACPHADVAFLACVG